MRIVGFVGRKGAGKDTAASALKAWRGYLCVAFADPVKELALRINPIVLPDAPPGYRRLDWAVSHYGWDVAKQLPAVRELLQELGTGVRDLTDDDAWLRAWDRRVRQHATPHGVAVVVPDVRRLNEADHVRMANGSGGRLLIRIVRPGEDRSDTHVSETEQERITCDLTVLNNGTPEELKATVLDHVDAWTRLLGWAARAGGPDSPAGSEPSLLGRPTQL